MCVLLEHLKRALPHAIASFILEAPASFAKVCRKSSAQQFSIPPARNEAYQTLLISTHQI